MTIETGLENPRFENTHPTYSGSLHEDENRVQDLRVIIYIK